ncbi:MAG: spermine/spermidine synthase [Bacillota bacterium]
MSDPFGLVNDYTVIERLRGRGGELQLQRRGGHYEIVYNGVFLMADYNGASERAAVRRSLERLGAVHRAGPAACRILMGGLGMGFSLQEALRSPLTAAVTVVEIEPAVIAWNRAYFRELNGDALADPRVTVINAPFEDLLRAEAAAAAAAHPWCLVVVDTDNGSTWLSREENAAIYSAAGLAQIRNCLVAGGLACFWCAAPEPALARALNRQFRAPVSFEAVLEQTGRHAGFYLAEKP